jgi:hypothetical protein
MAKKKSESAEFWKEEWEQAVKESEKVQSVYIGFLTSTIGLAFICGLLLVNNGELTNKVRNAAAIAKKERMELELERACKSLPVTATFLLGNCYVGNAALSTLEEIEQAQLHYKLGSKNE